MWLVIRTLKAVNGEFWTKNGYTTMYEEVVPKGVLGNDGDVVSGTMERWIDKASKKPTSGTLRSRL